MLNPNELRIGNWVNDIGGNPAQIIRLAEGKKPLETAIRITDEILEQCGFVNEGKIWNDYELWSFKKQHHQDFDIQYSHSINGNQKGYRLITEYGRHVNEEGILYLHELQNLYFALTQQELEVKLKSPAS